MARFENRVFNKRQASVFPRSQRPVPFALPISAQNRLTATRARGTYRRCRLREQLLHGIPTSLTPQFPADSLRVNTLPVCDGPARLFR